MNLLSRIAFPIAVTASVALGATDFHKEPAPHVVRIPEPAAVQDTVTYPVAGYKLRRALSLEEIVVRDTSAADELPDSMAVALDTVLRLSPRDSFKAQLDTSLWDKLDSLYLVDSTARAKAAFDAWYAGLSREERRKRSARRSATASRRRRRASWRPTPCPIRSTSSAWSPGRAIRTSAR